MYERVISLAPSNTEILFSLNAGDKIVGVTSFCDFPEETKSLPKIGSWINVNNLKIFDNLEPDLVLCSMFVPNNVKEWCLNNSVELVNLYPQTLDGVYDSFLKIGKLVDKNNEARELVGFVKNKFSLIKTASKDLSYHPKIYSEEFHLPPTVAANWVPELISVAGGTPMSKPGILSYNVSLADVGSFDPDIVVLHWCGFGDDSKKEHLLSRGWSSLRAVKNNNVFNIHDSFLNRPSPRIWQGAEFLQKIIKNYLG